MVVISLELRVHHDSQKILKQRKCPVLKSKYPICVEKACPFFDPLQPKGSVVADQEGAGFLV